MTTHPAERLTHLADQLAHTLMTAVICADEIRSTIRENNAVDTERHVKARSGGNGLHAERPLLDPSTFTVGWRGRRVRLGHTRPYWLLDRLAKHPNQYVPHHDLLHDVWEDDELNTSTIRSVVRHLRVRLRGGGMADLADAIQGHNGHYALILF